MKHISFVVFALLLCAGSLYAQGYPAAEAGSTCRAKLSGAVDWKITRGLHLSLEEQLRLGEDAFRSKTSLGLDYKLCPFLKAGVGYSFIAAPQNHLKHRASAFLMGSYKTGGWRFSVKETAQYTFKAYEINTFQQPQGAFALRSRPKISYTPGGSAWTPYVSCEFRHQLNAVDPASLGKVKGSEGTVSYSHAYLDRIRAIAGTEFRASRRSYLDFYLSGDYTRPLVIDASSKGRFKTANWEPLYTLSLGIAYKFAL